MNDPLREVSQDDIHEILEEVRRIELVSSRLVTDVMSGGYSSVFRGSGVEFSEVREYVDGDDPRSVDWNVTARMGRPFVKKYVDERELSVIFVVDNSSSMSCGFGAWSASQVAARLVAAMGISAIRNNDKVGLLSYSEDVDQYLRPQKGMAHVLRMVREILSRSQTQQRSHLDPVLEFASRVPRKHSVVFLISDFLTKINEEALKLCSLQHDLMAVRLTIPELEGLTGGRIRMGDPEGELVELVDWSDSAFRQAFRDRVQNHQRATEEALIRVGVDLIDVPIPRTADHESIVRPLMKYFRARGARGARQ